MWSISDMKARGKAALKANYWASVLTAFLLRVFVLGASVSVSSNTVAHQDGSSSLQNITPEQAVAILSVIFATMGVIVVVGLLIKIFFTNPLGVGCYRFFRKNVDGQPADLGTIGEGFSGFGRIFVTLLLRDIFLALWTMLLIIPGIIKSYSYRMVPYILKDNPELSATEVITRSRDMMRGNKGRAFLMDLSFIGWFLLSLVTLGLAEVFWAGPYYESAKAALYLELKNN